jgi:hypothetical protein
VGGPGIAVRHGHRPHPARATVDQRPQGPDRHYPDLGTKYFSAPSFLPLALPLTTRYRTRAAPPFGGKEGGPRNSRSGVRRCLAS